MSVNLTGLLGILSKRCFSSQVKPFYLYSTFKNSRKLTQSDVHSQSSAPLSRLTPGLSVHTNTRLLSTAERLMRCGRRSELTTHFDRYKWSCATTPQAAEDGSSVLLWKKQAGRHGGEKIWGRAVISLKVKQSGQADESQRILLRQYSDEFDPKKLACGTRLSFALLNLTTGSTCAKNKTCFQKMNIFLIIEDECWCSSSPELSAMTRHSLLSCHRDCMPEIMEVFYLVIPVSYRRSNSCSSWDAEIKTKPSTITLWPVYNINQKISSLCHIDSQHLKRLWGQGHMAGVTSIFPPYMTP